MKNLFIKLSIILLLIFTGLIVSADTCPVVEPETISMKIGGKAIELGATCHTLDYDPEEFGEAGLHDLIGGEQGGIGEANTWYFRYKLPDAATLSGKLFVKFAIGWMNFQGDFYVGIQEINAHNEIVEKYRGRFYDGPSDVSVHKLDYSFIEQVSLENADRVQVAIKPAYGKWRNISSNPPTRPEVSLITIE